MPETPHDVAALLFAAVGSSVLLGVVGGFPALSPRRLSKVLLWWVLRNTVFCFVGGVTFMVHLLRPPSQVPHAQPAGSTGSACWSSPCLCVYGTYHDPSLPLSWLLIIPSVWGGLTLTLRGTGYLPYGGR